MKTFVRLFSFALIAFTTACIPTLNPLFTDEDVITDDRLLGTWHNGDEDWLFSKEEDNTYALTAQTNGGTKSTYEVHLFQLGEHTFIDIVPTDVEGCKDLKNADFIMNHVIVAHTFYRVDLSDDKLGISYMDRQWLEEALKKNEVRLEHGYTHGGRLFITASTSKLQKFVLKHIDRMNDFKTFQKES